MTVTMPSVTLGDHPGAKVMNRMGELLGMNHERAVWRFGFKPASDLARAFAIATDWPLIVLTWRMNGRVIETWRLTWAEPLPLHLVHVIEWEPDHLKRSLDGHIQFGVYIQR